MNYLFKKSFPKYTKLQLAEDNKLKNISLTQAMHITMKQMALLKHIADINLSLLPNQRSRL